MKAIEQIFSRCEKTGAWYGVEISSIKQRNFMGDTVLHTVCSWGDVDAARLLVSSGADVNSVGDQGATPLFNAIIGKNYEVVSLLLDAGADPNRKNDYNRSVLDYAKNISASSDIIKLLSENIKGKKKPCRPG